MDFVSSQLNRTVAIVGSSMAVFAFILFFLYPRFSANEIDPFLFQTTLTVIVLVIFAFGFSGFNYFGMYGPVDIARKRVLLRRGNLLYFVGLILVTFEPTIILFTVGLNIVALIALALCSLFVFFVARQYWNLSRPAKGVPETG